MDDTIELYVVGLRNAHAMEKQALSIMEPQLKRIENYPLVADQLTRHIRETEGQIARLEELLDGRQESHSVVKDTVMSVVGTIAALGHSVADDEIIKNSLANFAFENYEIAAYSSLLVLADLANVTEGRDALEQNLGEEQAMADWLQTNLPEVTRQFVAKRDAGLEYKI